MIYSVLHVAPLLLLLARLLDADLLEGRVPLQGGSIPTKERQRSLGYRLGTAIGYRYARQTMQE